MPCRHLCILCRRPSNSHRRLPLRQQQRKQPNNHHHRRTGAHCHCIPLLLHPPPPPCTTRCRRQLHKNNLRHWPFPSLTLSQIRREMASWPFDKETLLVNFGDLSNLFKASLQMSDIFQVKVLKRNDDAGNDQWWKVKKIQDGSEGFVPANYLSLSLTRV